MSCASHLHASICSENRFITVGGKYRENDSHINHHAAVCVLDLQTLTWTEWQPLHTAVRESGVAVIGTDVVVVGGYTGKEFITQTYKYDARTGKRTSCQPTPKGIAPYNRTVAVDRSVFVLNSNASTFLQYDVETDQWSELLPPLKQTHFSAMALHNGRLVVTGGYESGNNKPHDQVQTYDISNNTWSLGTKTMPLPLNQHFALVLNISEHR